MSQVNLQSYKLIRNESGFSLIEIIIVLGIIGTLMAVVLTSVGTAGESAKKKETVVKAAAMQSQLLRFQADMGKLPTTSEGTGVLATNPGSSKWTGPYGGEDDFKDAWGVNFDYELSAKGPMLKSAGKDGQPGTEDDMVFVAGKLVDSDNAAPGAAGTGAEPPPAP